jgi:ACT domain-containing protein
MAAQRAVVTVVGSDRVGIVAGVSAVLTEFGVNIDDIRMATMGDLFTMIALVTLDPAAQAKQAEGTAYPPDHAGAGEAEGTSGDFAAVKAALVAAGTTLGVQVLIQRREIFDAMHRV